MAGRKKSAGPPKIKGPTKSQLIQQQADALIGKFQAYGENVSSRLGLAVHQASQIIVGEAKRRAPVDDGLLRRSIAHRVIERGSDITGQVGTNVHYAIHVEYGHRTRLGKGKTASSYRVSTFSQALGKKKKGQKRRSARKASGSRMGIAFVPGRFFLKGALEHKREAVRGMIGKAIEGAWVDGT